MKGQILVVDDRKKFDLENAVYVTNSKDAIKLLIKDPVWDEIYLDHDLGWVEKYNIFDEIRPLVLWMEERAADYDSVEVTKIRIISYNPTGRRYIWDALHKWYDVDTDDDWENHLTEA